MKSTIDQLIINSPYEEPKYYWSYNRATRSFALKTGRRPAGYLVPSKKTKGFDEHCGFGTWQGAVSKNPADVAGIIEKVAAK